MDYYACGKPHEIVELAHPFAVPLCKVVIDSDHMDSFSLKGVKIYCKCSHKSLSFSRSHLGDPSAVQDHTSHELNIIMPHAQRSLCSLSACCKSFFKDIIYCLSVLEPFLELGRHGLQLGVCHDLKSAFQCVYLLSPGLKLLNLSF